MLKLEERLVRDKPRMVEGYAPFCKHIFVENFTDANITSLPITENNKRHIRYAPLGGRRGRSAAGGCKVFFITGFFNLLGNVLCFVFGLMQHGIFGKKTRRACSFVSLDPCFSCPGSINPR